MAADTDLTTLHRAVLREYLEGIADLARHAGARGLKKGETETVLRHANAARAALKSLEIAAGWRGIGAALVDDAPDLHEQHRDQLFDAAMNRLLDQLAGAETWTVKADHGDTYEIAVYDGPKPGLYRATAAGAELLEEF